MEADRKYKQGCIFQKKHLALNTNFQINSNNRTALDHD